MLDGLLGPAKRRHLPYAHPSLIGQARIALRHFELCRTTSKNAAMSIRCGPCPRSLRSLRGPSSRRMAPSATMRVSISRRLK